MIEIILLTKTLNATEAGMTNTNDSYVLIPQKFDATILFPTQGSQLIRDYISGDDYQFRFESGREQRLYQLGKYCRDNNVQCGDILTIERRSINNRYRLFINAKRKHSIVFLQKHKEGYFIIRNDIGANILNKVFEFSIYGNSYNLRIRFEGNIRKRKDSPTELPFYSVETIDGVNLQEKVNDSYVELNFQTKSVNVPDDVKFEMIRQ